MDRERFREETRRRLLAARLSASQAETLADAITRDAGQYAAHVAEIAAHPHYEQWPAGGHAREGA
jgi:hypothetical protein